MIKKSSNLSKGIAFVMTLLLMLSLCPLGLGQSGEAAQTDYLRAKAARPNGQIIVQLKDGSQWVDAGSIAMDKYLREGSIDLGDIKPDSEGLVNIRLLQEGGGAAYLDSALLQGTPPAGINLLNDLALKKLSHQDLDLVPIDQDGMVLTFPAQQRQAFLSITGRIEDTRISTIPFQFPLENCYQAINANSSFYTYRIDSVKGSLQVDGSIDEVNQKEPFMKEHVVPGSGHPPGYTYAWVMNDQENLYITLDFTPDNTMDGDKDYAKVYINTNNGVKEYKVSVPETTWGRPGFVYTDKVGYQHKVYEFAIPLSEISLDEGQDSIQLAFAAYGTAALSEGQYYPMIVYDEMNNSYFTVFENYSNMGINAYGEFVDSMGTITGSVELGTAKYHGDNSTSVAAGVYGGESRYLSVWSSVYESGDAIMGIFVDPSTKNTIGDTILISDNNAIPISSPSIAYDSVNGRYLVVWEDYRSHPTGYRSYDIYGQLLNSDGSTIGGNFIICDNGKLDDEFASADQHNPFVAFDSENERYLVIWEDFRRYNYWDIYGQVVNADGTLYGTASHVNFAISETEAHKYNPVAAYDSINEKFLVVWEQDAPGSKDIYGKFVDTSLNLFSDIPISTNSEHQVKPAVAFNERDGQFMVVWEDYRNRAYTGKDIYGQMVSTTGTLHPDVGDSTTNMAIVARDYDQFGPWVAYNKQDNNFLVGFSNTDGYPYYLSYSVMPPQPVEFATKVDYQVGGQPNSVTAGDFNNDGKIDLAVANGNTGDFSILINNGDGSFGNSSKGGDFYAPNWIATEDLDADGNLDIVLVGDANPALKVFKGNGDGTFEYLTGCTTGTSANTVVIADFNGDSRKDLAVSNGNSHNISIFINNGDGTFGLENGDSARQANDTISVGQNPARLIAADFDNDGTMDLAVNNVKDDTVSVLLGGGDGNFTLYNDFPSGDHPSGLATADVNGDGNLDLIISNFETNFDHKGNVTILKGYGDGGFVKLTDVTASDGTMGTIVGDFNGDGNSDIAVANRYRNNVSILCGNGIGGFSPKQNFKVGNSPFNLTTADFDNDGLLDLAVVNNDEGTVSILLRKTSGAPEDKQVPTWVEGNVSASDITSSSVTLTWRGANDNVGVTGYKIYYGEKIVTVGNVLTTTITGLSPATTYSFRVEAVDAAGNLSTSGPVTTVTTEAVAVPDTQAPTWPGGSSLTASGIGTGSLALTWSAATDNTGVTGYRIYKNGSLEKAVGNVLTTVITGLSSSTTYSFKVEAGDAAGNWSTNGPETTATTSKPSSSGGGSSTPALAISSNDVPNGTVSSTYTHNFTAWGGRQPYTFAVTGGELPPGMSLSKDGILSGTPTVSGTYNYTITVTDAEGRTHSRTYSQLIAQGTPAPEADKSRKIILTPGQLIAFIDGQEHNLVVAPFVKPDANRTMVPLRFVSEALGAKVEWDPENRQVIITDGETQIILTIGSNQVFVNGIPRVLDCSAEILPPGYTFVPLRFISEALGATVEYDDLTQQITITRGAQPHR